MTKVGVLIYKKLFDKINLHSRRCSKKMMGGTYEYGRFR